LPRLEALETRYCPTSAGISITSLSNKILTGCQVEFDGKVEDSFSSTVMINIMGAAMASTTAAADGSFSVTVNAASLGTAAAVAIDNTKHISDPVNTMIACDPPVITNFSGRPGIGQTWTFTGTVEAQTPANDNVALTFWSGVAPQQVQTGSDGSFSLTLNLTGSGQVMAQTVDCWGQQSNAAFFQVS
jgi:hypothetical protein